MSEGERSQQDSIDQAEDGGGRSNAESQREYDRYGESRTAAELGAL